LYDKFIKWLLMQVDEFLEEASTEFKKWHFEQTGKYQIAFNVTYESIW
jgi:hypothetical protein